MLYARVDHLLCEDEEKQQAGRDSVSGKAAQLVESVASLWEDLGQRLLHQRQANSGRKGEGSCVRGKKEREGIKLVLQAAQTRTKCKSKADQQERLSTSSPGFLQLSA